MQPGPQQELLEKLEEELWHGAVKVYVPHRLPLSTVKAQVGVTL